MNISNLQYLKKIYLSIQLIRKNLGAYFKGFVLERFFDDFGELSLCGILIYISYFKEIKKEHYN